MFDTAFACVIILEGVYSNDANDSGGETVYGLTRKDDFGWQGWTLVDSLRQDASFPATLPKSFPLLQMAKDWYKTHYWDMVNGDQIQDYSTAQLLFDIAVNQGVGTAIQWLQTSINMLSLSELVPIYSDVALTREINQYTTDCLNKLVARSGNKYIIRCLVTMRAYGHLQDVIKNPSQRAFVRGWLNRDFPCC